MPYIGNSIKQVIKPTTESKFEVLEAISLVSSGVNTIDLGVFFENGKYSIKTLKILCHP